MKDSGVEWLARIPSTWQMVPNYAVLQEVKHIVGDRADEYTLLSLTKQGVIVRDLDAGGKFPSSFDTYKIVQPGQMIFCLFDIDETPRTVGLARNHGMITGAYDVFNVNSDVCDKRYLLYYYLIVDDGKHLRPFYASLRKTVIPTAFRHIKMPLPPLGEQQRIADYLDEQCATNDKVRQTITDEIEALRRLRKATIHRAVTKGLDEGAPMRDSGVEWIGEIPKSWTTMPLKQVCTFGKGLPITKADLVDEGLPVVSYGQIHSKKNTGTALTSDLCRHVEDKWLRTNKSALAARNDFLFADTSEDYEGLGNCAFNDTDDLIFAGYHTIIARPHGYSCPKYLAYLFRTDCWRKQIREKASGVKVFSATQSIFRRISVLVPTPSEQQRIADYLDERCAAIDSVINTRTKQLERLEDYRRALIFAYVTGKKEVPSHE